MAEERFRWGPKLLNEITRKVEEAEDKIESISRRAFEAYDSIWAKARESAESDLDGLKRDLSDLEGILGHELPLAKKYLEETYKHVREGKWDYAKGSLVKVMTHLPSDIKAEGSKKVIEKLQWFTTGVIVT